MTASSSKYLPENALPIIDIQPLLSGDSSARVAVGREIRAACLNLGFMYILGHGVDAALRSEVFKQSTAFFTQPWAEKNMINMKYGDMRCKL